MVTFAAMSFNFLFVFLFAVSTANANEVIQPFNTDGCTAYTNGTHAHPNAWLHCCIVHDFRYWVGGNRRDRKKADLELKACVTNTGYPKKAKLMYDAVRSGHVSPIHFKNAWSNAWSRHQIFFDMTLEQRQQLLESIKTSKPGPSLEGVIVTEEALQWMREQLSLD